MGCVPTDNALVVRVALPLESTGLPSDIPLSKNVTFPEGVPPLPVTVAVIVTDCPNTDGFTVEPSAVVVEVNAPVTERIAADADCLSGLVIVTVLSPGVAPTVDRFSVT